MADFVTIQNRVLINIVSTATNLADQVPGHINSAIKDLQRTRNWQVMKRQIVDQTTLAGTRLLVPKPALWKQPRQERPWWRSQVTSGKTFMQWLPNREEANKLFTDDAIVGVGSPQFLLLGESKDAQQNQDIEVFPYPNGLSDWTVAPVGEYRITIPYWDFTADLVNPTDTNWFTENGERYVEYAATAAIFFKDWDETRGQAWLALAAKERLDLERLDKLQSIAPMTTLVPRRDVFASKYQGR